VAYKLGRKDQLKFAEQYEYAEWGQVIYATKKVHIFAQLLTRSPVSKLKTI
jgi:hypothetical protein